MLISPKEVSITPDRKRQCLDSDDTLSQATILPPRWTMHKSVFSLSKSGDQWSTLHGKYTFSNHVVYPNFVSCTPGEVFDDKGESLWVLTSIEYADELGYTQIEVCCGANIPMERVEQTEQLSNDLFGVIQVSIPIPS
jgi:hypothetical protein